MNITVAIPTYNRSKCLDNMLKSIYVAQKKIKDVNVFVHISDNNSSDNTQDVVEKWSTFLSINYKKNEVNIGLIQNIIKTIDGYEQNGLFTIVGDDDEYLEDAFINIYEMYTKYNGQFDFLLLNRNICDSQLKFLRKDNCFYIENEKSILSGTSSVVDYIDNVKNAAGIFGLITSTVYSREFVYYIKNEIKKDKFWKDNLFPHVYFIFKFINHKISDGLSTVVIYESKPSIKFRSGLVTKGTNSDKKNSLIDFEEFYKIACKVFIKGDIFQALLRLIRRFYTLGMHFFAIDNPSKEDKEYHEYILTLVAPNKINKLYYIAVSKLLFLYRFKKKW